MRIIICGMVMVTLLLLLPPPASSQTTITRAVIGNGGGDTQNSTYQVDHTIGQPVIGKLVDAGSVHQVGFWYVPWYLVTGDEDINTIPVACRLYQNYPNPFNPVTTIRFALTGPSLVELKIYDVAGRVVRTLINKEMDAGLHEFPIDSRNLASGVYFYRLKAAGFSDTKKMILLR
ncbi:MAG: T9SS type A sorting domain-containing protein [Bacteroidales bacterium]|nr:T9SS type A sorting domain-containing protein [Candidatus Latescibacterota bacterium]